MRPGPCAVGTSISRCAPGEKGASGLPSGSRSSKDKTSQASARTPVTINAVVMVRARFGSRTGGGSGARRLQVFPWRGDADEHRSGLGIEEGVAGPDVDQTLEPGAGAH